MAYDRYENIIELCMIKQCWVPEGDSRYEKSRKAANTTYDRCRKKYDRSRGNTFAQYAESCIRRAIKSACKPQDRTIKDISLTGIIETAIDPSILNSQNAIYNYLKKHLESENIRITNDRSHRLQLFTYEYCLNENISLNAAVDDENDASQRQDFLKASFQEQPENKYDVKELKDIINETINGLNDRDRQIAILHFFHEKTIKEIAEITGDIESNVKTWLYSDWNSIYVKIVFVFYRNQNMTGEAMDLFHDKTDYKIVEFWLKGNIGFADIGKNLSIKPDEMKFRLLGKISGINISAWPSIERAVYDISDISGINNAVIESRLHGWLFYNKNGISLKEIKSVFEQRSIIKRLQLEAIHDSYNRN